MCTLCLSDMGELRDDWLREPKPRASTVVALEATAAKPVLRPIPPSQNPASATAPTDLAEAA